METINYVPKGTEFEYRWPWDDEVRAGVIGEDDVWAVAYDGNDENGWEVVDYIAGDAIDTARTMANSRLRWLILDACEGSPEALVIEQERALYVDCFGGE